MKPNEYHLRQYERRGQWFWTLRVGGRVIARGQDAMKVQRILADAINRDVPRAADTRITYCAE